MKIFCVSIVILFGACTKEYHPDKNAYRDPNLFGTWYYIANKESYPVLEVFTKDGYKGKIFFTKNYSIKNSLAAIYYTENTSATNNIIYEHSRFRNGCYSTIYLYSFSKNKDTLLLYTGYNHIDTLIMYKYQLIFDGPNYVGM